ncbi:hypothetical protein EFB08_21675, partial [Rufibacter latericius]
MQLLLGHGREHMNSFHFSGQALFLRRVCLPLQPARQEGEDGPGQPGRNGKKGKKFSSSLADSEVLLTFALPSE